MRYQVSIKGLVVALSLMGSQQLLAAVHQVHITPSMQFSPEFIEIKQGDTIEFINDSGGSHTVTADPARVQNPDSVLLPAGAAPFHSGLFSARKTYSLTLDVPGDYKYVCLPHERMNMIGRIKVVAAPPPVTGPQFACKANLDDSETKIDFTLNFDKADGVIEFAHPPWNDALQFEMIYEGHSLSDPGVITTIARNIQQFRSLERSFLQIEWDPGTGVGSGKMKVGDRIGRLMGKYQTYQVTCESIKP